MSSSFPISLFLIGINLALFTSCKKTPSSVQSSEETAVPTIAQDLSPSAELPSEITFNEHVQPILSEYCYHCHGPDSNTRFPKDDPLRLDIEDEAFAHRSNSKLQPIVKGDPAASNIIRLMKLPQGHEEVMPPKEAHKTMEAHEIAIIEKWIEQGGEYQKHWSFISPEKKEPTPLKTIPSDWVKNPIDAYTAAKMEEHGLTPNSESDPARLLRRLSLDITGLPPYPDELENFKKAHAADPDKAISDAVDVMLASDGYAENMARHWLDAARYADTHGIHNDNRRDVWPYRDWVINAFQQNMSFDQFTIEQIAGDLLPNPTLEQKIATGFGRCLPTTGEGGAINAEYEAIYAQDRTDTTAAIYLGMTMGCAACHDHKFDPISQKDNYSFNAFFRNTTMHPMDRNKADHPPSIFVPRAQDRSTITELEEKARQLDNNIAKARKAAGVNASSWITSQKNTPITNPPSSADIFLPLTVKDKAITAIINSQFKSWPFTTAVKSSAVGNVVSFSAINIKLGDFADFAAKDQFSFGGYLRSDNSPSGPIISRMDTQQNFKGWDLYIQGGHIATHIVDKWPNDAIKAVTLEALPNKEWTHVMVSFDGTAKPNESITIYINGISVPIKYEQSGTIKNINVDQPVRLGARDSNQYLSGGLGAHSFEFFHRKLKAEEIGQSSKLYNEILAKPITERNQSETALLTRYYIDHVDPNISRLSQEKIKTQNQIDKLRSRGSSTLIMKEKKSEPFAHILIRGEYSNIGEKVTARVPSILPPLPKDAPKNRLGLSQWLIDKSNPLTARVTMNRFWYYFFGEGIVTSTADFGIMGARPSHPKLLDYLAVEFMDQSWDMKKMVKLITTSATYRQSQTVTPEKKKLDGTNTYLARGPRYRLDAEQIRDTALFTSGLLSKEIGGPPVKPYQPSGVWESVAMFSSNTRHYKQDKGDKLYRRSLYTFWKRTAPLANMEILNAPSREIFCVRRDRTNTPLQAFVTLNDVQFVEAARHLAQQALLREKDFDARIDFITNSLLARTFSVDEKAIIKTSLEENLTHYSNNPDAAKKLITQGETKPNMQDITPKDLASWTITASQVFNLDENLNK